MYKKLNVDDASDKDCLERPISEVIDDLLKIYGFPPALRKWETPLPGSEWVLEYGLEKARGLYLCGESGVGKTVMTVLACRRWLQDWATVNAIGNPYPENEWRFVSCTKLVMEIQDAWRTDASAYKILKQYAEVPHLVMDDLGAEKPTDYVRQCFYFVINEREQWGRQTLITSNRTVGKLSELYDMRIVSRIIGICDRREISGRDRRIGTA